MIDQMFIRFGGRAMGGAVPVSLSVHREEGDPSLETYLDDIAQEYQAWKLETASSVSPSHDYHITLPSGVKLIMESITGPNGLHLDNIQVFLSGASEGETCEFYMESGMLDVGAYGEAGEVRFQNGKWEFEFGNPDVPNVAISNKFLGAVDIAGDATSNTLPANDQDSLAIGVEHHDGDPAFDAWFAEAKPQLVEKKQALAWFSPSLFSGKMRLLMQAQYGAFFRSDTVFFVNDNLSATFYGLPALSSGASTLGLFSNDQYEYWILKVTSTGVFAYPAQFDSCGESLRQALIDGDTTDPAKMEAYLLACATFDTQYEEYVGALSMDFSGTLGHGWKFNKDGSKATVIAVKDVWHSGCAAWKSQQHDLTFSHTWTKNADGEWVSVWSMSHNAGSLQYWVDGWGQSNIFVPDNGGNGGGPNGGPLALFSSFTTTANKFEFDNIPIYCWYNDSDTLVYVRLSHAKNTTPHTLITGDSPIEDNTGGTYERVDATSSDTWRVIVAGAQEEGVIRSGSVTRIIESINDNGAFVHNPSGPGSGQSFNEGYSSSAVSGGYSACKAAAQAARAQCDAYSLANGGDGHYAFDYARENPQYTTINRINMTGNAATGISVGLVIPCGDCEAAIVSKCKWTDGTLSGNKMTGNTGYGTRDVSVLDPWSSTWNTAGSYTWMHSPLTGPAIESSTGTNVAYSETNSVTTPSLTLFNKNRTSVDMTDSAKSYYALFIVDRNYPYYDPSVVVRTSVGLRVTNSEKPKPNPCMPWVFVGWV